MKIGLWYGFRNPERWRQPFERLYAETFDHVEQAEELGFDDIQTGEHHPRVDRHLHLIAAPA